MLTFGSSKDSLSHKLTVNVAAKIKKMHMAKQGLANMLAKKALGIFYLKVVSTIMLSFMLS